MQGHRTLTLCPAREDLLATRSDPKNSQSQVPAGRRQPWRGKENRGWVLGLRQTLKTRLPAQGVRELSVVYKYRMPWRGLGWNGGVSYTGMNEGKFRKMQKQLDSQEMRALS